MPPGGKLSEEQASAIEPAIKILHLSGGIDSFRSLLNSEDYRHPFSNFIYDVLRHTDLPQLAASLAPRRVITEKEPRWDLNELALP